MTGSLQNPSFIAISSILISRPVTLIASSSDAPISRYCARHSLSCLTQVLRIVDSASTTAAAARDLLEDLQLVNGQKTIGDLKLLATDGATRFARVGGQFLGEELSAHDITLVDL